MSIKLAHRQGCRQSFGWTVPSSGSPSIMNGLKNRNVEDILIACVDDLSRFPQAIDAIYPETETQQYIIHQILN